MAYTSSAIPSMLSQNNSLTIKVDIHDTTWIGSLLALGALFGSLSAVYLMDAIGRKASLLAFSVMSLFIGWTLLMAASQTWQMCTGRFLLGLGAGLEITISPVYIHEICRPVLRDVCGSFPQVFIAVGILLCYLMGRTLEWNWLALVSCVFLFPFTFGLYFIPESPPWLVYNDEEDLAFKSMVLIRGEEYDATVEIRRIKDNLTRHRNDLHALLHESEEQQHPITSTPAARASLIQQQQHSSMATIDSKFEFRDLLRPNVLHPFIVILVLMFLLQFSGQGAVTFYTALIFEEAQSVLDPKDCAVIIGLSYFLSSILGLVLKKHFGRRPLLLISEFGMAVSQLALGVYFYILKGGDHDNRQSSNADGPFVNATFVVEENESDPWQHTFPLLDMKQVRWLPIPILIIFTVAFNIGMGSLTWVVATEILPVRSKRWTHTISNVTSNLWWFVVTKTFKDIYIQLGPSAPFFIYGSVCVFGFIFIFLFLPETHGKTAEETAKSFIGIKPILRRVGCKSLCHFLCLPFKRNSQDANSSTNNDQESGEEVEMSSTTRRV